jgi:CRISPR-associated protein Cmr1
MKDKYKTQDITIEMETLTPLWTGGVGGLMDGLHQTGIIGSLHWWYEAIVRGLGYYACDPTSHECKKECPVCSLFGRTGQKRKFIINIDSDGEMLWDDPSSNLNIRPYGRRRGWFLPPGFAGTLNLRLYGENEKVNQIASLIQWLSRWGSIGAKSQLGYGIINIRFASVNIKPIDYGLLGGSELDRPSENLPDLRAFTFFRFRFVPLNTDWWKTIRDFHYTMRNKESLNILENLAANNMVPVSPLLKNYFRFRKNWKSYTTVKWLFGSIGRYTQKSKVIFSWAYKTQDCWEIRGWAWLPYDKRHINEAMNTLRNSIPNESEWLKALDLQGKVSKAKLYIEPRENPWRTKDSSTIQKWLTGGTP